ncbi:histone-like nucleoid-structuring protein Lsr2 [Agromyces marinus]|nr:Lsr2 family protein [Agromyces marinus]UIP58287.1 Nucleoid-associated protein Lsr2 [Agromyces marinus]
MAKRVIETLIDDLDGSDADRTVSFALDGDQYAIDLSDENIAKLGAALAPFIGAARKTAARGGGPRRRSSGGGAGSETKDAREWLRANGHEVSDRGRIPANLMELYRNR